MSIVHSTGPRPLVGGEIWFIYGTAIQAQDSKFELCRTENWAQARYIQIPLRGDVPNSTRVLEPLILRWAETLTLRKLMSTTVDILFISTCITPDNQLSKIKYLFDLEILTYMLDLNFTNHIHFHLIYFNFSVTWSCVSLPRHTTSSDWKVQVNSSVI